MCFRRLKAVSLRSPAIDGGSGRLAHPLIQKQARRNPLPTGSTKKAVVQRFGAKILGVLSGFDRYGDCVRKSLPTDARRGIAGAPSIPNHEAAIWV